MGRIKRRNRSIERTKEGVSELLFGSVGAYVWAKWVLALGAPWVLAELESSVSQSKQQFWILGFANDDKEASSLCSGLLAVWWCWGEAGAAGASHQEGCATFPWSQGHVLHSWALMSLRSTELSLWALISHTVTHTNINRNYWLHISTTEPNFQEIPQGNLCGPGIFDVLFLLYVCPPEVVSPEQWLRLLFFQET